MGDEAGSIYRNTGNNVIIRRLVVSKKTVAEAKDNVLVIADPQYSKEYCISGEI